jgi:hypothetical protein
VPEERLTLRTKGELALDEIDRVRAAGVTCGCVLADAGYGASAESAADDSPAACVDSVRQGPGVHQTCDAGVAVCPLRPASVDQ